MTLLFCDIESTGLVPEDDVLLEVGFAKVTDELELLEEISIQIHLTGIDYWNDYEPPFGIPKVVADMHKKSGLWKASHESKFSVRAAENRLFEWVIEHGLSDLPLVGNTIGFDRNFLRIHMGRLHDIFHYRSVDISSIKILHDLWTPDTDTPLAPQALHRSLPDIRDSLEELRKYRGKHFESTGS